MAHGDDKGRQSIAKEENWEESIQGTKDALAGKVLPPHNMDLAVMRLRSAAYVLNPEHWEGSEYEMRKAALIHTRDAMVLAWGCFTADEKKDMVLQAQPVTRNGITQLEPTHVTITKVEKVTEYKVLASPWTWLKLKLLGKPTVETTTQVTTNQINEARL